MSACRPVDHTSDHDVGRVFLIRSVVLNIVRCVVALVLGGPELFALS
jgi:hypothetical protein